MSELDLPDIQGNIHRPYGREGFPYARYMVFNIRDADAGRWFIDQLMPQVTTAEPWRSKATPDAPRDKPRITLNVALTWRGLLALDLPTETLRLMPNEFIEGMACRNHILGDLEASDPDHWDPVWMHGRPSADPALRVHAMVMLNAAADAANKGEPVPELQAWTDWVIGLCRQAQGRMQELGRENDGVVLLAGHGRKGLDRWQDSGTIMAVMPDGTRVPTPKEHFGFMDGISDPIFAGQSPDPMDAVGSGKIAPGPYDPVKSWQPLAPGEFILGVPSEGQEIPVATVPSRFMRNGTFMALRKLHQNINAFETAIAKHAETYSKVTGIPPEHANETLRAKMVGRWPSGVPLIVAPTKQDEQEVLAKFPLMAKLRQGYRPSAEEALAFKAELDAFYLMARDYRYIEDREGAKCPFGAHVRRVNPRDMLDPEPKIDASGKTSPEASSRLTNRRRILRRGLPYGERSNNDADEHGVFIMALCTSLFRQFEFIQQQWLHYGLDLEAGSDACPITGRRDPLNRQANKFVVNGDAATDTPPYIAADLPLFVETRGGEYFFIPSLTALRMIAMGTIDPT